MTTPRLPKPAPDIVIGSVRTVANTRPSYDEKSLTPEFKSFVDYWFARSWSEPPGPFPNQLRDEFLSRHLGAEDGLTVACSKTWPGWMIDSLAVAWAQFRQRFGTEYQNVDATLAQHPGYRVFRAEARPAYGMIETDFQQEQSEILAETCCVRSNQAGLLVAFKLDGFGPPSLAVTAHEANREAAQALIDAFSKAVEATNIYRGKQLTFANSRIKFTRVEAARFEDVIMDRKVIDLVRNNTVALADRKEAMRRFKVGTSHSTILAGAAGTGKTLLGRAVATALGSAVTTWVVTAKAFYGSHDVETFYEMVRSFGPAFVIFEDIDLVGRDRSSKEENPILGELLNQMSGTRANDDIITMASTNDLAALDAALSDRPERIGTKIEVPLPGAPERRRMLEMFAAKYDSEIAMSPMGWHSVIKGTEGLTGDYCRALVKAAVRAVIMRDQVTADASQKIVVSEANMMESLKEILRSRAVGRKTVEPIE